MTAAEASSAFASSWSALRSHVRLRTRLRALATPALEHLNERRFRLPPQVSEVYEAYARHPHAIVPDYGPVIASRLDAGILYHMVRRFRPMHVVEFGGGLGTMTAIVALALEAEGRGRVTSLEHLEWMTELAGELMPEPCASRVEILLRPEEIRHYFGQPWTCYRYTPTETDVDFVIVDGPPTEWTDPEGRLHYLPNGDLLELLPCLRPGCHVFVDGRVSSVEAYRRHLGHLFRVRPSMLNYTILELREQAALPLVRPEAA